MSNPLLRFISLFLWGIAAVVGVIWFKANSPLLSGWFRFWAILECLPVLQLVFVASLISLLFPPASMYSSGDVDVDADTVAPIAIATCIFLGSLALVFKPADSFLQADGTRKAAPVEGGRAMVEITTALWICHAIMNVREVKRLAAESKEKRLEARLKEDRERREAERSS